MILLSVDEVVSLHRKIITATGGSYELRDRGLLESAIYSAAASFSTLKYIRLFRKKRQDLRSV